MQATVATFDDETGRGSLLRDDGTPVDLPSAAFAASGLRRLRLGQRLRLEYGSDGTLVRVTVPTLP